MKHTNIKLGIPGICLMLCALASALAGVAAAQAFGTTTVQGTVYLANGNPGSGTLQLSWPAFTTAANQAVTAGRTTVSIGSDGFLSVNLAPNLGSWPAGLYYTAVYHLSDGTTSTEYWVVPAAAQAAIAQVRATVMPAAQAVQAVNKAYVDQSIEQLVQSQFTSSGGNMTEPLYLNGDPATPTQAATKHYVDSQVSQTLSINGGAATGPLTATQLGAAYQADQFQGADFGAKLQACINALNSTYGGSCDARNFSGTLSMGSNVTISKANVTVNLPCATIATSSQIIVTAGTRNVTLHGCASRGTTAASGNQGGTVFLYSGSGAMIQVGDSTYASDTLGFHLDNVVLNTTSSASAAAQAVTVWRAQELHLEGLYLLGNANQTGITLDGTGNYTGGTFDDVEILGFQTAVNAVGHKVANAATTDWVNASTFVRLHIDCPTSNGSAIAGTTGINLAQGDGNTFTGGDVEGCATAMHLGANAQNNTIVGLRNENSTYQVVADTGSAYNNWITGGTMFTGKLTDNGTRNSFLDTFHRSFNALNGDWFGSQQDTTLTNHYRLGIGSGNERGLLNRYQTDSGYRWTTGLSDAAAGEQYYQVLDELNNVNRLSIGQYNTGQGSSNNQTVINAAGTGAVVLNGSNSAGSGGVVFGSGGSSSSTVATINNAGSAQFNGTLQVGGVSTFLGSPSIRNQADAEIDALLWAGATAPQKESVIYKDWNGNSQWYMVKDTSNNWALNSAVGGVDSFKAYQSTNSGDTYLDAANNTGVVRVNYEPGSGSAFNVYGGGSGNLYASFNGTTGIKFPGLAAGSGHNCVQIDNSGYLSNTGVSCGTSSVGLGTTGQIAYYAGNGTTVTGMATSGALATLGGLPMAGGTMSGPLAGTSANFSGYVQASSAVLGTGSNTATGLQVPNANAAVTTRSVLAYGAAADYQGWFSGSVSSSSATLTCASCGFTSASVGKWIVLYPNGTWTPPFAPITSNLALNSAQITTYISATQVTLNRASTLSENVNVAWGTDLVTAMNACAAVGAGMCTIPAQGNGYLAASVPYYVVTGASDDGGYTVGGGAGGTVTCTPTGGSLTSGGCTVSGGTLYTPSSTLQTTYSSGGCAAGLTYNYGTCGQAFVTVTTNSTGVPTTPAVIYGGFGLTTPVVFQVNQLSGTGASGTATITGGTMNTPTLTSGGAGYPGNSSVSWAAIGGGCANIGPGYFGINWAGTGYWPTDSSGHVTGSPTVTTNATGCTSAPTIVIGGNAINTGTIALPVWSQPTNVSPLNPITLPVQVPLIYGVSFNGTGGSGISSFPVIYGTWDGVTADNNQAQLFGGVFAYNDLGSMTFNNIFNPLFAVNNANYGKVHDWNASQTALCMYTAMTDLGFQTDNIYCYGQAGWVNGGQWHNRSNFLLGGGGFFDAGQLGTIIPRLGAYGGPGSVSQKLDDWFANNFWHPEFSGASTDFPAGETCKFPQTINQRQLSTPIGYGGQPQYHVNQMCYRGISSIGLAIYARDARGTGDAHIGRLTCKGTSRACFVGSIGAMDVHNVTTEQGAAITGINDPYRSATTLEAPIIYFDGTSALGALLSINGESYTGSSSPTQPLWDTTSPTFDGQPNLGFTELHGVTGLPNNYVYNKKQNFWNGIAVWPVGIDIYGQYGSTVPYEGTIKGNGNGGMQVVGPDGTTQELDWWTGGFNIHEATTMPSLTLNGGTNATGTVGNGGKLQETTSATKTSGNPVAFDSNGNTVNATVANEFSLFTGCSGTMYAGYDGACHTASGSLATASTPGTVQPDGVTITVTGGGVISASNPSAVNPDSVTCTSVALTTTSADVCNLTIPANRVPFGGVYEVNAFCSAGLTATGTASSYTPIIYFYNSANSTKYAIANGQGNPGPGMAVQYGYGANFVFTGFGLLAPSSGTGFTQTSGQATSYRYDGQNYQTIQGPFLVSTATAALVSSSGSNQIQMWMATSFANTSPNTVTCTITGSLRH